jgi:[ribosomal protein S5]-alanine N-acetyltransferase
LTPHYTSHETARLELCPLDLADADFIIELLNEHDFLRFIGDKGVRDHAGAREYLTNGPLDSYARHGFGLMRVTVKGSSQPVGVCGLTRKPWLDDPDIAYAFLPEARGKGYAFEAASAVVAHARRDGGIRRIVAVVTPDNAASIRVVEKLGLQFERIVVDPSGVELKLFAG